MATKSIKTVGAVTRAPKTETKPKIAARRNGNSSNGSPSNGASKIVPVPKRKTKSVISTSDIALRAYFIAEKRRTTGLPGDELGDWVEAERQLLVEKERN